MTPLSCTFSLLRSKNTTAESVIALVMSVIDNLLSWEDMDMPSEDVEPILADSVATEVTESCMFCSQSIADIILLLPDITSSPSLAYNLHN